MAGAYQVTEGEGFNVLLLGKRRIRAPACLAVLARLTGLDSLADRNDDQQQRLAHSSTTIASTRPAC